MSVLGRTLRSCAALALLLGALLVPAAALADEPLLDVGTISNRYEELEEGEP